MGAESSSLSLTATAEVGDGPCTAKSIPVQFPMPGAAQLLRIIQVLHSFPSFPSLCALFITE